MDRTNFESLALDTRSLIAYRQGHCAAAGNLAREAMKLTPAMERNFHLTRACSPDAASVRRSLRWLRADVEKGVSIDWAALGGKLAAMQLALGRPGAAKLDAARGLAASREFGLHLYSLENALALRAAERRLGDNNAAAELTSQSLALARRMGFEPPESFGGRVDLLRLWKAGAGLKEHPLNVR